MVYVHSVASGRIYPEMYLFITINYSFLQFSLDSEENEFEWLRSKWLS